MFDAAGPSAGSLAAFCCARLEEISHVRGEQDEENKPADPSPAQDLDNSIHATPRPVRSRPFVRAFAPSGLNDNTTIIPGLQVLPLSSYPYKLAHVSHARACIFECFDFRRCRHRIVELS